MIVDDSWENPKIFYTEFDSSSSISENLSPHSSKDSDVFLLLLLRLVVIHSITWEKVKFNHTNIFQEKQRLWYGLLTDWHSAHKTQLDVMKFRQTSKYSLAIPNTFTSFHCLWPHAFAVCAFNQRCQTSAALRQSVSMKIFRKFKMDGRMRCCKMREWNLHSGIIAVNLFGLVYWPRKSAYEPDCLIQRMWIVHLQSLNQWEPRIFHKNLYALLPYSNSFNCVLPPVLLRDSRVNASSITMSSCKSETIYRPIVHWFLDCASHWICGLWITEAVFLTHLANSSIWRLFPCDFCIGSLILVRFV